MPTIEILDDRPINFIENIWHYLSPFSAHQIEYQGHIFSTVEHAYHFARFKKGSAQEAILKARSPEACLHISRQWREEHPEEVLTDFDKAAVMETLFRLKLNQHPQLIEILKLSGTRCLMKEISSDAYWGTGPDGCGQNIMGRLWMKIRNETEL